MIVFYKTISGRIYFCTHSLNLNPFSIKSEPILQNEPIIILYPFRSPFTRIKKQAHCACFFYSSMFPQSWESNKAVLNDDLNGRQMRRRPTSVERGDRFPSGSPQKADDYVCFFSFYFLALRATALSLPTDF